MPTVMGALKVSGIGTTGKVTVPSTGAKISFCQFHDFANFASSIAVASTSALPDTVTLRITTQGTQADHSSCFTVYFTCAVTDPLRRALKSAVPSNDPLSVVLWKVFCLSNE